MLRMISYFFLALFILSTTTDAANQCANAAKEMGARTEKVDLNAFPDWLKSARLTAAQKKKLFGFGSSRWEEVTIVPHKKALVLLSARSTAKAGHTEFILGLVINGQMPAERIIPTKEEFTRQLVAALRDPKVKSVDALLGSMVSNSTTSGGE